MLEPLVYFVPPAQRAIGLHRGLQLCRTCEKRWKRQMGGGQGA